jgi:thiosulfate/3-mercaptopyruvate sulfurtransferase
VAYDDGPGNWAARLWWLLRHYGHADATVLDGGIGRWKKLGFPLRAGHERPRGDGDFDGQPGHMPTTDAAAILATLDGAGSERWALVDVRARERYRGDTEPVDPVAGHIPGARNRPYSENVATDGRFLPPADLARTFDSVADGGRDVVVYCGSGVTSAQGVLAMEIAGLATPRLYPGSWSEWCRPAAKRPVERTDREA